MSESAHPFVDSTQQREAAQIGMWIFLATEVMFFGGLFAAYSYFHHVYTAAFESAGGHTDFWLGTANTALLLMSSLTMALAVQAAKAGQSRRLSTCLILTMVLGSAFLMFKGMEYAHHIQDHLFPGPRFDYKPLEYSQAAQLFFYMYFTMTGVHALHMMAGLLLLATLTVFAGRGKFSSAIHTPVVLAGLYWHFVDIVWIFLFPMFYLVRGH